MNTSHMSVVGKSSISVPPNKFTISFSLSYQGDKANDLITKAANQFKSTYALLSSKSIDPDKLSVSSFSISDHYIDVETDKNDRYGNPIIKRKKDGYTLNELFKLEVDNIGNCGKAIDCVVQSGINSINSIEFSHSDEISWSKRAKEEAIKNALDKANLYANAANVKLVKVLSISDYKDNGDDYISYNGKPPVMAMAACSNSLPLQINSEDIVFSEKIYMTFEIARY